MSLSSKIVHTKVDNALSVKAQASGSRSAKWGWVPHMHDREQTARFFEKMPTFPNGQILVVVPNVLRQQWYDTACNVLPGNLWNVIMYPTVKEDAPFFWSSWEETVSEFEKGTASSGLSTVVIMSYTVSASVFANDSR